MVVIADDQSALFGEVGGRARRSDPETSHAAASRVRAGSVRAQVLDALRAVPAGLTDDEICGRLEVLPRRWPTVKTARSALTHCDPPVVAWSGAVRAGQRVWQLVRP